MKRLLSVIAICLAAVGCTDNKPEPVASLDVSPLQLTFEAKDAQPQTITVTAENVDWEHALTEESEKWITVERRDNTLTVTPKDNTASEPRSATLNIHAKDNKDIKPHSVSITQKGSDVSYSIEINPATLSFEAEGAPVQTVTVTAEGERLTWKAEVEESAKGWINVSEGEGKFTVTVTDNPETEERSANITVTPGEESAKPKAVRVTQKGKVLPPSLTLTLTDGATLEEGLKFDYTGTRTLWNKSVEITAVNIKWDAKIEYDSDVTGWVEIHPYQSEDKNQIELLVHSNEAPDPRTGSIEITTDAEGVGPFTVEIAQEGKPDFLSTLTENRELKGLTHATAIVKPNSDTYNSTYTTWDLRLWSDGLEFDGRKYIGSGDKLCVFMASEPISGNPENVYYLPDGVYNVVANFNYSEDATPGTVSGGLEFYSPDFPLGTWYQRIENDSYTEDACIAEGTVTVSRSGEVYKITFELVSDASYSVTGSYEGTLEVKAQ